MKSILRILSIAVLSVLLISMLSACNNAIGLHNSNSSIQPSSHAVQPPPGLPTMAPTTALAQPAVTRISPPQPASQNATGVQSDPQGDEIEQSLNALTNDLNATDTLDDLK